MQKQVSKQSLAIVALSILLAIAMALTATFAVFKADMTTSGTIRFNDGFTLTTNMDDSDENGTYEFTVQVDYNANGTANISIVSDCGTGSNEAPSFTINGVGAGEVVKIDFTSATVLAGAAGTAEISRLVADNAAGYKFEGAASPNDTVTIPVAKIIGLGDSDTPNGVLSVAGLADVATAGTFSYTVSVKIDVVMVNATVVSETPAISTIL